jgi:cytochrome c oxidase subunit 2
MKKLLVVTAMLAVAVLAGQNPPVAHAEEGPKVVEISAKRFGFTPDHITLKQGEPVILRLTSLDVTHGFFSRDLKVDELIEAGKTTEVRVQPQKAGTFTVICDHFCGSGHGNMKMTVTVE